MRRIILIILIIICVFILIGNTKDRFEECKYKHFILDDNDLNNMKELYIHLTQFFKEKNIKYFAIGGTLIGTVRNGGLMPFDDDVDIGVLQEDIQKIESYTNGDYYFQPVYFGYKFFKKGDSAPNKTLFEKIISGIKRLFGIEGEPKTMFIDIMVFELKDDMYTIISNSWPNEAIKPDELLPLTLKQYSSMETYVPGKYTSYLNRAFPQWDTKIKLNCGHFDYKCVNRKMGTPTEIDVHYDNDKYLCYTNFENNNIISN